MPLCATKHTNFPLLPHSLLPSARAHYHSSAPRQFTASTCITLLFKRPQEADEKNGRNAAKRKYAPPGVEARDESMYDVEQSPEEIARALLENVVGSSDQDETESVNSDDNDGGNDGGSSKARVGYTVQKGELNPCSKPCDCRTFIHRVLGSECPGRKRAIVADLKAKNTKVGPICANLSVLLTC